MLLEDLTEAKKIDDALKNWFGDSKVRIKRGRPMTVFRGITNTVEKRHPGARLGIFASPSRDVGYAYSGGDGKLLKLYMKIENPYYMEYEEIQKIKKESDAVSIRNKLIGQGYDGIFLKPISGGGAHPNSVSEYIAFHKNQIREI